MQKTEISGQTKPARKKKSSNPLPGTLHDNPKSGQEVAKVN
jgi:hypothetical protein